MDFAFWKLNTMIEVQILYNWINLKNQKWKLWPNVLKLFNYFLQWENFIHLLYVHVSSLINSASFFYQSKELTLLEDYKKCSTCNSNSTRELKIYDEVSNHFPILVLIALQTFDINLMSVTNENHLTNLNEFQLRVT